MERPSHIHFDTQSHAFSRRLPLLGLALCLQASVVWLLAHELINRRVGDVLPRWIEVSPLPDKQPDNQLPPPPDPTLATPDHLTAVLPIFDTASGDRPPVHVEPRQANTQTATLMLPDRAPIGIASTHTVPPYPPIARRIGAQGKVTLRLTVTAEGRVSAAEVVTSSGRDDLDQTAQQWIMAHWIYKPALANGVPMVSRTLATVTFSLTNER
ncbi:MAG TPA: energy transducer TonB [Rhizomicrobium sp.]|nr:energy transducer TonB [Rhizomicrobium sp.]